MRKSYRIKKEDEFQKVFFGGNSVANKNFVLYQIPKSGQKHFRVGISVGKKVALRANKRNQIKRYIRQSLFELRDQIPNEVDFLIIARKTSLDLSMSETKNNITHLLKLGKIIDETR
ncbi:ribonuclease P protein component [Lactobacillus sp. YT155]|uniref:ribonuclease P protein component n=1 Tax=Lactobacillus sp. YT155 TaxID=3060955 RepID=UPI00265DC837|nr:ribonuclease P protein component [Lactobacillus sp. YT155]MDO1604885.1 ribonuclease P protein component [Lactobacillus sp. YT155]